MSKFHKNSGETECTVINNISVTPTVQAALQKISYLFPIGENDVYLAIKKYADGTVKIYKGELRGGKNILAKVAHNPTIREFGIVHSTPALIEELEKRRPCEKCENYGGRRTECINCLGAYIHYMRTATDNYKEANHGKV